jgi:hypothetical protein
LDGCNNLHVSCSVSSNGGHIFFVVEEDVHMAPQRLRWAPQNFMGGMVASLPHACIGTPPWKLGGAEIPPNGGT